MHWNVGMKLLPSVFFGRFEMMFTVPMSHNSGSYVTDSHAGC